MKITEWFRKKASAAVFGVASVFGEWAVGLHSLLSGSRRNWTREAGPVYDNAVVAACLNWYCRQISYPKLKVVDSEGEPVESPLPDLIKNGPLYDGSALWAGTLLSYFVAGMAFWLKVRDGRQNIVGFVWLPHTRTRIYSTADNLIAGVEFDGYDGRRLKIPREDLVIFRHGVHPDDPRVGISPLIGALRDVTAENLAATLSVSLLKNNGVGAAVLSAKGDITLSKEQYERVVKAIRRYSTGDLAGSLIPVPFPVEVSQIDAKLKDMQFDKMRAESAARICAAFGLDPMVVSLPSESKTYSNYAEANEAAHEQGLLPLLQRFAEALTRDVIPELHPGRGYIVDWDLSAVRALADDQDALYKRVADVWRAGVITRAEARRALGYEAGPGDDLFIFDVMFASVPLRSEAADRIREAAARAREALLAPLPPAKNGKHEPNATADQAISSLPDA